MTNEKKAIERNELDMAKLFKAFAKRIWLIALCAIIGGGAMAGYVITVTPDTYTASAMMYVYTNNPNQVNYQYTDQTTLNTATRLMETYMVVIKSNKVMDAVSAKLNYVYTPQFIASSLRLGSVSGTEVMHLSATTTDPQLSMDICNAVAEFAPAEILRVVNAGLVEVIDYATLPIRPDDKYLTQKALIGAVTAAVTACLLITLLHIRDRRVRADTDLSEIFGLPLLVSLPKPGRMQYKPKKAQQAKRKPKVVPPTADVEAMLTAMPVQRNMQRFVITENSPPNIVEIHKMFRTTVNSIMEKEPINALVVASAVPSEGKSIVSANLAIVAAQEKQRVLLIDADMRKPMQYKLFGLKTINRGLSDVLLGIRNFEQSVRRNVRPGLDLLPAGKAPTNPVELLSSPAMRTLMVRLRAEYDWVIIDTPPMDVVADSLVLANQVAGTLMVVRRNVSNLEEINIALHAADRMNMRIFGFVLTDARGKQVGRYRKRTRYYSDYGMGYQRQKPNVIMFNREQGGKS